MAYSQAQILTEAPREIQARSTLRQHITAGIVAGQIAGLIMAAIMMLVFTIFLGKGPLYPVQVIGSFVFGDEALGGFHLPALLTGLVLHQLGPSLFWGAVFGLLTYYLKVQSGPTLTILAVISGLLSQAIDVNILLPFAMTALHGHNIWAEQVPAFWSWAAHFVFGLGLLVYPRVFNRLAGRSS